MSPMRGHTHRLVLTVLVAAVTVTGCEPDAAESVGPTVLDSAGVRFVEHPPSAGALFELGATALVEVGLGETTDLTLFEVAGGVLTSTDGFIIADAGNFRLVRWSVSGELLSVVGRQGDGPGEFQSISWMHPTATEVALYDGRARRISWFDPTRGFLRSVQFDVERPDPPSDDAIVASGTALGVVGTSRIVGYAMAHADPVGEAGPLPLYGDIAVFDSAGTAFQPVGRFMLMEWYEDPSIEGFPLANRMEAPRVHWSGRGDLLAIADAVGHRVDVLQAGSRTTVILESRSRHPFSPDSIPSQYHLAADSLQAYRDVRVDSQRRIWVKPAVPEGEETTRWRVFSEDGFRIGDLPLPTDATVLDAGETLILLLRRSDLDEESVELWELRSPGG